MAARRPVYDLFPPRIESIESLELALAELCRIDALEKHLAARVDDAIARERQAGAELMVVDVGEKEALAIAEWRSQLEAAIEKYAKRNKDELLEEGKKSREFNHATLKWTKQKPSLKPLGDFTAAGNPKPLDKVITFLREALGRCADLVGAFAARFLDVKVAYRKTELLKAMRDKELTAAELRKIGYELDEGEDAFSIELKIDEVASTGAAK